MSSPSLSSRIQPFVRLVYQCSEIQQNAWVNVTHQSSDYRVVAPPGLAPAEVEVDPSLMAQYQSDLNAVSRAIAQYGTGPELVPFYRPKRYHCPRVKITFKFDFALLTSMTNYPLMYVTDVKLDAY